MEKNGFKIKIPGGFSTAESDWYPFVSTFNDNAGIRLSLIHIYIR